MTKFRRIGAFLVCAAFVFVLCAVMAPTPLSASDGVKVQFVADNHVLMLRADGRLIGWGDNTYGQLGLGDSAKNSYSEIVEIEYFKGKGTIKQIALINNVSFVLLTNGQLYSAGQGTMGKNGQGDTYNKKTWGRVGPALTFKKIYTNADAEFAVAEDFSGSLYTWGKNDVGQLGVGDTDARTSPTLVKESANAKEMWVGETYVQYIDLDGDMYYWGSNSKGQMGLYSAYTKTTHSQNRYADGSRENVTEVDDITVFNPETELSPKKFELVSEESISELTQNEPAAPPKGSDYYKKFRHRVGDLPKTSNTRTSSIIQVKNVSTETIPQYMGGASGYDTSARVHTGTLYGKKANSLGLPSSYEYVQFVSSSNNDTTMGSRYTCKDWYVGASKDQYVGPSTSTTDYLFVDALTGEKVVNTTSTTKVYYFYMSAMDEYGTKSYNNIALGVSEESYEAIMNNKGSSQQQTWYTYKWKNRTLFDTVRSGIQILTGSNHNLAMYEDKVYGWGAADKKQLGNMVQQNFPVEMQQVNDLITSQKAAGVNFKDLFVDRNSNYITFDDGTVWAWGDNSFSKSGAVGAPVTIQNPTKVETLQDKDIIKVVAGKNTNYYITSDGEIYVSGSNLNGISGLGKEYEGEATIQIPTLIESIGYSETELPPEPPAEVEVEVGDVVIGSPLEVRWNSVAGAERYKVERTYYDSANAEVTTEVYNGPDTRYVDKVESTWARLSYKVTAINSIGDYSAPTVIGPFDVATPTGTILVTERVVATTLTLGDYDVDYEMENTNNARLHLSIGNSSIAKLANDDGTFTQTTEIQLSGNSGSKLIKVQGVKTGQTKLVATLKNNDLVLSTQEISIPILEPSVSLGAAIDTVVALDGVADSTVSYNITNAPNATVVISSSNPEVLMVGLSQTDFQQTVEQQVDGTGNLVFYMQGITNGTSTITVELNSNGTSLGNKTQAVEVKQISGTVENVASEGVVVGDDSSFAAKVEYDNTSNVQLIVETLNPNIAKVGTDVEGATIITDSSLDEGASKRMMGAEQFTGGGVSEPDEGTKDEESGDETPEGDVGVDTTDGEKEHDGDETSEGDVEEGSESEGDGVEVKSSTAVRTSASTSGNVGNKVIIPITESGAEVGYYVKGISTGTATLKLSLQNGGNIISSSTIKIDVNQQSGVINLDSRTTEVKVSKSELQYLDVEFSNFKSSKAVLAVTSKNPRIVKVSATDGSPTSYVELPVFISGQDLSYYIDGVSAGNAEVSLELVDGSKVVASRTITVAVKEENTGVVNPPGGTTGNNNNTTPNVNVTLPDGYNNSGNDMSGLLAAVLAGGLGNNTGTTVAPNGGYYPNGGYIIQQPANTTSELDKILAIVLINSLSGGNNNNSQIGFDVTDDGTISISKNSQSNSPKSVSISVPKTVTGEVTGASKGVIVDGSSESNDNKGLSSGNSVVLGINIAIVVMIIIKKLKPFYDSAVKKALKSVESDE